MLPLKRNQCSTKQSNEKLIMERAHSERGFNLMTSPKKVGVHGMATLSVERWRGSN